MEYRIIRSRRRTIAIQIAPDGQVLVRCPLNVTDAWVDAFIRGKSDWIQKHLRRIPQELSPIPEAELRALTDRAKKEIPGRVAYYASLVGVQYGRITVRHQKTRWGSCSAKGNLSFNCLLMLAPPEVLDYVVVHELCHRKEMNHSQRFWDEVVRICPDYRDCRKWLRQNGVALMAGVRNELPAGAAR